MHLKTLFIKIGKQKREREINGKNEQKNLRRKRLPGNCMYAEDDEGESEIDDGKKEDLGFLERLSD